MDIAHRMDAANLLAVPRPSDFVDAHARSLSARAYTAALRGHQSALVVTDLAVQNRLGLDSALATYCNAGHGVVLGGQTHWLAGGHEGWPVTSAVGGQTTRFASRWAMYTYDDVFPNQVSAGAHQLAPGSVEPHFLTQGLHHFTVVGPGSGEAIIQDYSSGRMLARLRPASGPFATFGQVFLAERQIGAGRVVDLGFRPWSAAVADGGFDPAVSAGGALTARVAVVGDEPDTADGHALHHDGPRTRRTGPPSSSRSRAGTPTPTASATCASATASTAAAGGGRSATRSSSTASPTAASTRSGARRSTRAGTSPRTPPDTHSVSARTRSADRPDEAVPH